MHMVFEDSETVASSLLIKQAYLQEALTSLRIQAKQGRRRHV